MKDSLEKSLKRYLKRKVKITLGFVVAFLLGTSLTFADNLYIKEGEKGVEFSQDNKTWGENPYFENIFENGIYTNNQELELVNIKRVDNPSLKTFINNGNIKFSGEGDINLIEISWKSKIDNLINNGLIEANMINDSTAWGMYVGTVTNLENNGIIKIIAGYQATGIENFGTMENLINNNEIFVQSSGIDFGITNSEEKITNLINNGNITVNSNDRAIGIANYYGGTIDNLANRGKILVNNSSATENTWGINNNGSHIGTLENDGELNIKADSGSIFAINNYVGTYENIINNGNVFGEGKGYITIINNEGGVINRKIVNNGNIYANSSENEAQIIFNGNYDDYETNSINEIINNGVMKGTGKVRVYGINSIKSNNSIAQINKIENNGIIDTSGNRAIGIYSSGNLGEVINNGVISSVGTEIIGKGTIGISTNGLGITDTNNKGIIKVKLDVSSGTSSYSSAGIYIENIGNQTKLLNSGIIEAKDGREDKSKLNTYGIFYYSPSATMEYLTNNGVVFSDRYTIYGANANATNNGLLIGNSSEFIKNKYINNGMMFSYNSTNNNYKIQGIGENTVNIINATLIGEENKNTDNWTATGSENIVLNGENKSEMIYNGITDTLKISGENSLTNSTVNGYTSAIVFDEKGGSLILDNSIINGELDEESATIKGSEVTDNLTLTNGTIINGDTDLGDGDDKLSIDNTVQINGDLNGGVGIDNLTFNNSVTKSNENNINIFNEINNFENINVGTNVTFFESSKVTGAEKINIDKDGNLVLRIDTTNGNSHALSENEEGIIHFNGGKLLLALNGVGEGETISFGNNILDETMKGNEIGYSEDITLDTTSLLHKIKKENENTVIVNTVEDLPTTYLPNSVDYNKINEIYQSMRVSDQVGEFKVTDDKTLTGFVKYLHDIYAGFPYAFSSELSRKSMNMFKSSILSKDLKPELNKWAIYGGLTHIDGGTKDEYYGKGYYTYDVGSRDISADTKITGAYMQAEYGKSETLTTGIVFGGNNSETELGASKVEGDSFYFGAYAKKYLNDFRFTLGAGFQHGDYKSDRTAMGYEGITNTRDFSENYHDRGFNIYGDVKYSKEITENLFIEPYFTLGYSYVDQDGVSEDGTLAIETDSKNFDYATGKVGLDVKKVIPMEKGKHILTAGVSYENILSGDEEEYITGRFKGGSDFDILVPEKNSDIFSLNAKYEFEFENGVMFDVKGTYTFENDNIEDEWIAGVGVGYRF